MKKIAAALVVMFGLTACGQTDPPTNDEVRAGLEFFEMTSPSGVDLECLNYGSESEGTQDSKSWFSVSCWRKGEQ